MSRDPQFATRVASDPALDRHYCTKIRSNW